MPAAPLSSPEPSDDALMAAYAGGDAAAFERLYARHRSGLYRFVRRLLGRALDAQVGEVFQDTWLRVVQSRTRWQPQGAAFRTWLYTLAHHRVIDLLRRSGREVSLDMGLDLRRAAEQPGRRDPQDEATQRRKAGSRRACGRAHG